MIKNTEEFAGEEVAKLYIHKIDSTIFRAKKELRAFEKVALNPGESKRITITLEKHDFSYYNQTINDWAVEHGD